MTALTYLVQAESVQRRVCRVKRQCNRFERNLKRLEKLDLLYQKAVDYLVEKHRRIEEIILDWSLLENNFERTPPIGNWRESKYIPALKEIAEKYRRLGEFSASKDNILSYPIKHLSTPLESVLAKARNQTPLFYEPKSATSDTSEDFSDTSEDFSDSEKDIDEEGYDTVN